MTLVDCPHPAFSGMLNSEDNSRLQLKIAPDERHEEFSAEGSVNSFFKFLGDGDKEFTTRTKPQVALTETHLIAHQ